MRRNKFRVWSKIEKTYIFPNDDVESMDVLCIYDDGSFYFRGVGELYETLHKLVLEQYTGLKDYNGVEICEGDILRDINDEDDECIVKWNVNDAMFELWFDSSVNNFGEMVCTAFEVIGNIREGVK